MPIDSVWIALESPYPKRSVRARSPRTSFFTNTDDRLRGWSSQFLQQSIQLRQLRSRHVLHLTAMQVENRLIELGEQVYAHGGDMHDDKAAVFGRPKKGSESLRPLCLAHRDTTNALAGGIP